MAERDSIYLASVTADGWPYMQHRGGPKGFRRVLGGRTLAFADFAGNKQYITSGNLVTNNRISLFAMDYIGQAAEDHWSCAQRGTQCRRGSR